MTVIDLESVLSVRRINLSPAVRLNLKLCQFRIKYPAETSSNIPVCSIIRTHNFQARQAYRHLQTSMSLETWKSLGNVG